MKKKIAVLAIAATMMAQTMSGAYAGGVADVLTLPFRLVTGVAGVGVGAVAGGLQGVVDTEQKFAENTFGQADENPMMLPVGIVGTAVAVPVGIITGAPKGAVEWGEKGFNMWDGMTD